MECGWRENKESEWADQGKCRGVKWVGVERRKVDGEKKNVSGG